MEYCYFKTLEMAYVDNDIKRLQKLFVRYENFLTEFRGFELNSEYTQEIYRDIGLYYFENGHSDLAEQTLKKGIRMFPDNAEMKGILKSIIIAKGGSYEYPELMDDKKPLKKYLMALARAKDNLALINQNVDKYLVSEWKFQEVADNPIIGNETADVAVIQFLQNL
jgi:hypothetical protein